MMKLVFGRVPNEYLDDADYFTGKSLSGNTAAFYYTMEVEDEEDGYGTFKIIDTCGRFMPMDFDQLDELISILTQIKEFRDDKAAFIHYWKTQFGQP